MPVMFSLFGIWQLAIEICDAAQVRAEHPVVLGQRHQEIVVAQGRVDQRVADVASGLDQQTCIIDSRPTFDVKLKTVLSREPLPELVLVTNRCDER